MTEGEATSVAGKRGLLPVVGLVLWLVVLPAALAGLGLWQVDRSSAARIAVEEVGRDIARTLAELREIAAQTPDAPLRFENGQSFSASLAVDRFEADRRSSRASSPAGAASALVRSHVTDAAVRTVLAAAFEGRGDAGPHLVAATAVLARDRGFPDPAEHLEDRQPHPTDSHPPTIQRVQALGIAVDDALLVHATRRPEDGQPSFGRRAFKDWDGFCATLGGDFLSDARIVRAEIRQELETAAAGIGEEETVLFENSRSLATSSNSMRSAFAA